MTALAPIVGYLIGSLPTTNGIARLWGVDLRSGGTGNPGTNNARRLGGYGLAGIVLIVEVGKGVLAVFVGFQLGGDLGAALAGIGAVAGNVYKVWYRFRGGKGLGIAGGVLLAIWPLAFPIMVAVLVLATLVTGSSGQGALIALVGVLILSIVWTVIGWSTGWGASDTRVLILLSAGFGVTLAPKHLHDARSPATPSGLSHRSALSENLPFPGLDDQGDRSIVYQAHLHVSAEPAGRGGNSPIVENFDKPIDHRRGMRRVACPRERRAPTLPDVAIEGELAHHERLTVDVRQRQVHPAAFIGENPQARDLLGDDDGLGLTIGVLHAHQQQKPAVDLPHHRRVDHDPGPRNPL